MISGINKKANRDEASRFFICRKSFARNETLQQEKFYYTQNSKGDIIGLKDETGNAIKSYDYDPFGNEYKDTEKLSFQGAWEQETSQIYNPFGYCGEYQDEETGFIYLRGRYYDPATERFITEDPMKDGGNWYVYCGNDPINYGDPTGYDAIWLNDEQGASGFGHASLLVQDDNGEWYHINFGPYPGVDNDNMGNATVIVKKVDFSTVNFKIEDGKVVLTEHEYTEEELSNNRDAANYYTLNRYFDKNADSYVYIEGDFTESLEKGYYYVDNQPNYEFTSQNCAWFALRILQASYDQNSDMYKAIDKRLYQPTSLRDKKKRKSLVWPDRFLGVIEDLFKVKREVVPGNEKSKEETEKTIPK